MQHRLIQLTLFSWLFCLAATAATDEAANADGTGVPMIIIAIVVVVLFFLIAIVGKSEAVDKATRNAGAKAKSIPDSGADPNPMSFVDPEALPDSTDGPDELYETDITVLDDDTDTEWLNDRDYESDDAAGSDEDEMGDDRPRANDQENGTGRAAVKPAADQPGTTPAGDPAGDGKS